MTSDSETKTTTSATTPSTATEGTFSTVLPEPSLPKDDTSCTIVPEAPLPKLVVCFDLDTLSLQDLQTIASDLNLPDYSQMTKEQLCETLLSL